MKGDPQVVASLNALLADELSAMDQYFVHARMYQDWGFEALYQRIAHESDDERRHAQLLIERILFLGGQPDIQARAALTIGQQPKQMLENDLQYEYKVAKNLRNAIALCESKQDFVSRDLLLLLLDETEDDHMYWLEKQLHLIGLIGLENYLQSQVRV